MNDLPIVVREKKVTLILGIVNIIVLSIMVLGSIMVWTRDRDPMSAVLGVAFSVLLCYGIYVVVEYYNHRIIIDEEKVLYISTFGKKKEIKVSDIGRVTYPYSGFIKMCRIFDKADNLVISFELVMTNSYEAFEFLNKLTNGDEDETEDETETD